MTNSRRIHSKERSPGTRCFPRVSLIIFTSANRSWTFLCSHMQRFSLILLPFHLDSLSESISVTVCKVSIHMLRRLVLKISNCWATIGTDGAACCGDACLARLQIFRQRQVRPPAPSDGQETAYHPQPFRLRGGPQSGPHSALCLANSSPNYVT